MYDYNKINQLELDLNQIKYKGIAVGSLLAPFFDKLISNRYVTNNSRGILRKIYLIIKALFFSFRKRKCNDMPSPRVYYKSGDARHFTAIHSSFDQLYEDLRVVTNNKKLKSHFHDFRNTGFDTKLKVIIWAAVNSKRIYNVLQNDQFKCTYIKISLILDMIIQAFKAVFWREFFKKYDTNQIIGDYDRGKDSSSFFAAAKSLKIKSIVLQHGVISIGSGGYFPLIADSVFVWGEIAKKQLLELGLSANRIKITGTPIVQRNKVIRTKEAQINLRNKYGIDNKKKLVVLAINPIEKNKLNEHIKGFKLALDRLKDCQPLIKLHPAQNEEQLFTDFPYINEKDVLSNEILNHELFIMCDLLLAHNSGIVNEALLFETNVAILNNMNVVSGNGLMLHKYFGTPILKTNHDLYEFVKNLNTNHKKKDASNLYYKVGDEAKSLILEHFL